MPRILTISWTFGTKGDAVKIEVHDIVAVRQSTNVTSAVQGDAVLITGVLKNDGSESETFTVRCYYGTPEMPPIQIGSDQIITLNSGESITLNFVWDTSGVDPGTYWIEIRAISVAGELDTDDNTCTVETPVTIMARAIPYVGGEITPPFGFNASEATMLLASILLILATLAAIALLSRKSIKSHS